MRLTDCSRPARPERRPCPCRHSRGPELCRRPRCQCQLIFNTALPQVAPGADLKGVVTDATKSLVKSGQISRGDARPAAMAAGECLKLAMK